MRIRSIVLFGALLAALPSVAITAGSCISAAKPLLSTQTVKLVKEYDPDTKETDPDSGVCYFSVTLTRGKAYTIALTGGSTSEMWLDGDVNDEYYDQHEELEMPTPSFDINEYDGGATQAGYIYAEDWDEYDPASGKYIVAVYGDVGATATLSFTTGIRNFATVGSEENPQVISMKTSWKANAAKLLSDGDYYFRASLKAGRKYRVRTTGATKAYPLSITWSCTGEAELSLTEDTSFKSTNPYDQAFVVVPSDNGVFDFGIQGKQASQAFAFRYMAIPTRAITAHPSIPLTAGALADGSGYEARFVPGRMANNYNYYDNIIDDHLCKIYLKKGERWVFETEGATMRQTMVVYAPTGQVLGKNVYKDISGDGTLDYDSRVVITAAENGIHYVGVCDPTLDVTDVPKGGEITLSARKDSEFLPADGWDPADNGLAGATTLVAYPATTNDTAVSATDNDTARAIGAVSGPHRFNAADTYDVFAVSCRPGNVYAFRATYADGGENATSGLHLTARVYSAVLKKYVATLGSISPVDPDSGEVYGTDLMFKAGADGIYYVIVSVEEGLGLDFPGYDLHAAVMNAENPFGIVQVVSEGANGAWALDGDATARTSGAIVTVEPGDRTIKVGTVAGFDKEATKTVSVPAWTEGSSVIVVTNRYSDIYDKERKVTTTTSVKDKKTGKTVKKSTTVTYPPDDTIAGAVALTPVATEQTAPRTLWHDDPADWFVFTPANAYTYYNFELAGRTGDATLVVSNATDGVIAEGVTEFKKKIFRAEKTWIIVRHGTDDRADSSYELAYSRAAVGGVTFTAAAFAANQGAEYATLTVARTGTEGAMRVLYATQAESAQPGTNYYPVTDGAVSWAVGDKSAKTIKVRLIPDLVSQWEGSNKTFRVKLYPVDEYALADNEYLAIPYKYTEAQVVIKETAAKQPGTIALTSYGPGTPVTNVKAPIAYGTAGDGDFSLTFSRLGGSDGEVMVKVVTKAQKGDTAAAGKDFLSVSTNLTWKSGDDAPQTVTLPLVKRAGNDYVVSRKFSLAIGAYKTTGTVPALASKTATVVVKNPLVAQPATTYAKTIPAASGVKLATTGTWFVDTEGTYRSAAAAGVTAFTLTGPGLFVCEPELVTNETSSAKLVCQFIVGKKVIETIDCGATNFSGRIARAVAAGATVVKFTLAGVVGDAYARFKPQADGAPYAWTRFAETQPADPMNKAVLTNDEYTLVWTLPPELAADAGLYCRVRAGTNAKLLPEIARDAARTCRAELPLRLAEGTVYYWTLDYYYGKEGMTQEELDAVPASSWVTGPSTWYFSKMVQDAPVTDFTDSSLDAAGESAARRLAAGEAIELIQGVKPKIFLEGSGVTGKNANCFRYLSGTLPPGVTVAAATGELAGVPSTPGDYTVLLQSCNYTDVKNAKTKKVTRTWKYGNTIAVNFHVLPAGTALGAFRAALTEDGFNFSDDAHHLGFLAVSVAANGKMSAKATIAGITYAFSGYGYDEIIERDDTRTGLKRQFHARLTGTSVTTAKKKYANYLDLYVGDGDLSDTSALATNGIASAYLVLNVLNAKKTAVTPDVYYEGAMRRYNAAYLDDFAGYYTMALAPIAASPASGNPAGNGLLTMTVDAAGIVKFSGILADGVKATGSTIGQLCGDDCADPKKCQVLIPVYAGNAGFAVAGTVILKYEQEGDVLAVFEPASMLDWVRSAAASTSRSGDGFSIQLAPTGGWYDKVANLQAYYLNGEFEIQAAESGEDLPAEALAAGYSFSMESTPQALGVHFTGNALVPDAYKVVKDATTGLYDFSKSVNPWNVAISFNRATGIMAGTFMAWEWVFASDGGLTYATKNATIKKIPHYGIMLYSRDSSAVSPLPENVLSAGFFLMPATKSWKASLPFNVIQTNNQEKNYDEKEFD